MKNFKIQTGLQSTIRVNKFIYNVSIIPFIKGIVPYQPYRPDRSRVLLSIIFFFSKLFNVVLNNILNSILYLLPYFMVKDTNQGIGTWLVVASFSWGVIRGFFKPTIMINDTYVNKTLQRNIRMPAKDIARNNTIIYFINVILYRLTLIVASPDILTAISIILVWYGTSLFANGIHKQYFSKYNEQFPKNKFLPQTIVFFLVILAGMPMYYILLNVRIVDISSIYYFIAAILILVIGFFFDKSMSKNFDYYSYMHMKIRVEEDLLNSFGANMGETVKSKNERKIDHSIKEYSGKRFTYLNNIFFDRYVKVYSLRFKITNIVLFLGVLLSYIVLFIFKPAFSSQFITAESGSFLNHISFVFLLLYFLNMGEVITNALFFNCDASMLRYRLYNKGSNVLPNFFERLKKITLIHVPQGLLMSLLVIVLAVGLKMTNNFLDILMLFVSINVMNMFFCIHSLVLYYVLQPYDKEMKIVNKTYSIINSLTYFAVYILADFTIELWILTIGVIIFSILYILIASFLMYFVAPKTFRIK